MLPVDWTIVSVCAIALGALVAIGEGLRAVGVSAAATRRLVHAGVGLFVAGAPWVLSGPGPLYVLGILFVGVNGAAKLRHWFPGMHTARPESWGTVTFPLALLPALAMTWSVSPDRVYALQGAFLVLAVADPMASWAGARAGTPFAGAASSRRSDSRADLGTKTGAGCLAFAATATVLTAAVLGGLTDLPPLRIVVASGLVGGVGAAVEVLGGRGWDNFFVIQAVVIALLLAETRSAAELGLVAGVGLAFGATAWRAHTLTASGAVGGGLLAAALVGLGGWAWAVPGFGFFVLSSALSRLGRRRKAEVERQQEKGAVRDLGQVLANGGAAWACVSAAFVTPPDVAPSLAPVLYAGFLGAFAAAAADTWATELGTLASGHPVDLRTGTRVPPGTSGAVSLLGTAAGGAGALVVALLGVGTAAATGHVGVAGIGSAGEAVSVVAGVVGAGLAGMAADSLAGATIQARYRDPETGALVERRPVPGTAPDRGWRGVTNDVVNGIGTTVGAVVAMGVA